MTKETEQLKKNGWGNLLEVMEKKNMLDRLSLISCQTSSATYFIQKDQIENAKQFIDCLELNIKELKEKIEIESK